MYTRGVVVQLVKQLSSNVFGCRMPHSPGRPAGLLAWASSILWTSPVLCFECGLPGHKASSHRKGQKNSWKGKQRQLNTTGHHGCNDKIGRPAQQLFVATNGRPRTELELEAEGIHSQIVDTQEPPPEYTSEASGSNSVISPCSGPQMSRYGKLYSEIQSRATVEPPYKNTSLGPFF